MLLVNRAPVSEHHLIALMTFAAAITALVFTRLPSRDRKEAVGPSRTIVLITAALAIVYIGAALYWQFAAIQGLRRTGGVGQWSDGINPLALYLEEKHSVKPIKILDWGLQTSLFVLTDGKVRTQEIYGDATPEQSGLHRTWLEEIRDGGTFVMNGPDNRMIPAASCQYIA